MRSGSWIQTTGPNNGHQLRDYSKSSNRSENRPLIYTTNYTYNVRSWLKTITAGNLFTESLYYDESHNGSIPCFSGNISALDWKAPDNVQRGYKFYYDKLSRLTHAIYLESDVFNGHFNSEYSYDYMGNMLTLKRYGLQDNSSYGLVDDLSFTYNGNQLIKADDAVSGPYYAGAFHFRDGADEDLEYEYDENGSMTKDLNKNISSIQYNSLNLPSNINYLSGNMASYVYSAVGKKLSVQYQTGATNTNSQYCDNMIYENGQLRQIQLDQGYITFSGTSPQYHFYLKDHLGNNRMVVNASGTVEQVNHYYAFGGLMGESTGGDVQDFKYNGKELDRLHGLDWFDYGARHYDGVIGSWPTMDPLCEKYYNISPYAYCANNPINSIDINGDSITVDKYGENLERKGNDNNVYMSENGKDVYIGEIGKSININDIAKNVFARNAKIAKELKNPISFYKKVKTNGDWDLKNKENTIWQFAKTHNINFQYGNEMLKAEDVGNFNFGIVAKAYGIPENIALKGAGLYQIYSGTSSVEWQKVGLLINSTLTPSGIISTSMDYNLLAPYGDDPIDQYWIKRGYNY